MNHYRKTIAVYSKLNARDAKSVTCHFCQITKNEKILTENETMFVVANRIAYDMFADRKVMDHLLIIPKKHHDSIQTFSDQEKLDSMRIMGEYEGLGYDVYARSKSNTARSVKHQHTHLIKLEDTPAKLIIYARKPYMLWNI